MKAFFTLAAIVAAAQASEWEQFKATHGKLYGSQGEVSFLQIWQVQYE